MHHHRIWILYSVTTTGMWGYGEQGHGSPCLCVMHTWRLSNSRWLSISINRWVIGQTLHDTCQLEGIREQDSSIQWEQATTKTKRQEGAAHHQRLVLSVRTRNLRSGRWGTVTTNCWRSSRHPKVNRKPVTLFEYWREMRYFPSSRRTVTAEDALDTLKLTENRWHCLNIGEKCDIFRRVDAQWHETKRKYVQRTGGNSGRTVFSLWFDLMLYGAGWRVT